MNQLAFPQSNDRVVGSLSIAKSQGMTLRDYFAAKAIQGFLAYAAHKGIYAPPDDELASASYQLADAMLKARGE